MCLLIFILTILGVIYGGVHWGMKGALIIGGIGVALGWIAIMVSTAGEGSGGSYGVCQKCGRSAALVAYKCERYGSSLWYVCPKCAGWLQDMDMKHPCPRCGRIDCYH